MTSSPACWRVFGEVLTREFGDPAWFTPHQTTVDAYAAQHPGSPGRRQSQSVALHLTTLGLVFERGFDPADGPELHKRMAHRPEYTWLEPPSMEGRLTVIDVHAATDSAMHRDLVHRWGRDVWDAWSDHHATIWRWLDQALAPRAAGRRRGSRRPGR